MDTSDQVKAQYLNLIATLTPEERFARMNNLCAFGKLAMIEGLRHKYPQSSQLELELLLARNLWGEPFAKHLAVKYASGEI